MPSTPETKIVNEYDIFLSNGSALPITLEPDLGDTFSETETEMVFDMQERRPFSEAGDETVVPAEHVVIYKKYLAAFHSRKRTIKVPQAQDWVKYLPEFDDLPAQ